LGGVLIALQQSATRLYLVDAALTLAYFAFVSMIHRSSPVSAAGPGFTAPFPA
jgi:hypothetical protein